MQYIAVGDKFIAKKIVQDTKTSSGVYLPQTKQKRFQEAEIIDVDENFKTKVKKGDIVRYWSVVFEYEDGLLILREDHIAAIIKP